MSEVNKTNQYEKYYEELQQTLKSVDADKENVVNMFERAHAWLEARCGFFDLSDDAGRDLVFNRVRYDYNGVVQDFYEHFERDILNFRWKNRGNTKYDVGDSDG